MFPKKVKEAMLLRKSLAGVRLATSCWPVKARGKDKLETVTIFRNGKTQEIDCDYPGCGFHLVPNVEMAQLLGCSLRHGFAEVDAQQQSTIPDVYCVGEPTGIGGLEQALVQGQIAGLAACGRMATRELLHQREKARAFAQLLDATYKLRPELKTLSKANTIVCRCEDVMHSRLAQYTSWRAAKLHTRCGMGPCQGRVCGPATEFLFGWHPDSIRPPVFPARVASLSAVVEEQ